VPSSRTAEVSRTTSPGSWPAWKPPAVPMLMQCLTPSSAWALKLATAAGALIPRQFTSTRLPVALTRKNLPGPTPSCTWDPPQRSLTPAPAPAPAPIPVPALAWPGDPDTRHSSPNASAQPAPILHQFPHLHPAAHLLGRDNSSRTMTMSHCVGPDQLVPTTTMSHRRGCIGLTAVTGGVKGTGVLADRGRADRAGPSRGVRMRTTSRRCLTWPRSPRPGRRRRRTR
jgi:hypothetical protein